MPVKVVDAVAVGFNFRAKALQPFAQHTGVAVLNLSQAEGNLAEGSFPDAPIFLVSEQVRKLPLCRKLRNLAKSRDCFLVLATDDADAAGWLENCLPQQVTAPKKVRASACRKKVCRAEPAQIQRVRKMFAREPDMDKEVRLVRAAMAGVYLVDRHPSYGLRSVSDSPRVGVDVLYTGAY